MPAINGKLLDKIIRFQVDLRRMEAGTRKKTLETLQSLQKELVKELSKPDDLSSLPKYKINEILSNISQILIEHYSQINDDVQADIDGVAKLEVKEAANALKETVFVNLEVNAPTKAVIDRLSNPLVQGGPMSGWWNRQRDTLKFKFGNEVRQGILLGETNQQIIQRIVGKGDIPGIMRIARNDAAALVQTAINKVANDARQSVYENNGDVIKSYVHLSTLDSRTSIPCMARSNKEWKNDKDKTPIGHNLPFIVPPVHFNCLPGDTRISAADDVTGTSKRWFNGKVVIIKTSSGRKLTSTPNHPILTSRGWVKSSLLYKGCDIISSGFRDWVVSGNGDSDNMPPKIHNLVESFLASRNMFPVPMPMSSEDFHGDGESGKIAVVYSDSFLLDRVYASILKHFGKDNLIFRYIDAFFDLFSSGCFLKSGPVSRLASRGSVGMAGPFNSLLRGGSFHSCGLLFFPVSNMYSGISESSGDYFSCASNHLSNTGYTDSGIIKFLSLVDVYLKEFSGSVNPVRFQTPDNRLDTNPNFFRNSVTGMPGSVFLDNIVSVDVVDFHDYVYNVETKKGWYIANGIITHNCRSVIVPRTLTFEELGIDSPEIPAGTRASSFGQVDANITFDQYLSRLPKTTQDDMLGAGRAELWRDGKISLSQLLDGRGRELTLKQLEEKYL